MILQREKYNQILSYLPIILKTYISFVNQETIYDDNIDDASEERHIQ